MGIHVFWYSERPPGIIVYRIVSPWTMTDLYNALEQAGQLTADGSASPQYIIYDVTRSTGTPPGFYNSLRRLEHAYEEDVDLRVLVGADGLMASVYRLVNRIAPRLTRRFVLVPDFDTALQRIYAHHRNR